MLFGRSIQIRLVKAERPSSSTTDSTPSVADDFTEIIDYAARTVLQGAAVIIAMQTLSKIIVLKAGK